MTINSLVGTECPTEILKIINQIIAQKSSISLDNLDATGTQKFTDLQDGIDAVNALVTALTAVVNTKISAECLLQQNGYIKFSNGLLICWGYKTGTGTYYGHSVTFPISFTAKPVVIGSIDWSWNATWYRDTIQTYSNGVTDVDGTPCDITTSGFTVQSAADHTYIAIGY